MLLYHFTTYFSLPDILRDGITTGEVPLGWDKSGNAANLTNNPDLSGQNWATRQQGIGVNKCRVRLTVVVEESELRKFMDVMILESVPGDFINTIDPKNERRKWYLAYKGIPKDQIVEFDILENGAYESCKRDQLDTLVEEIEEEKRRIGIKIRTRYSSRYKKHIQEFDGLPGWENSWLLDR